MNRREVRHVPKDKVGERVQEFVDEDATSITVTPEGDGAYRIVALLP